MIDDPNKIALCCFVVAFISATRRIICGTPQLIVVDFLEKEVINFKYISFQKFEMCIFFLNSKDHTGDLMYIIELMFLNI